MFNYGLFKKSDFRIYACREYFSIENDEIFVTNIQTEGTFVNRACDSLNKESLRTKSKLMF